METRKKRIAMYLRLSKEDQHCGDGIESASISNQRKLLLEYISSLSEFSQFVVTEYCDDGFSGTDFARPQMKKLIADAKKGLIDVIIVKDFSRLGRDYLHSGALLDKFFPVYGVRFISVNDHYDSLVHQGYTTGIDVSFRNVVNEMYSRDISVKNRTAKEIRYRLGEYINAYAFYGYSKATDNPRKLVVDQKAADVVKQIFELASEGLSTYRIAQKLNSEDILSPYEYKRIHGITLNGRIKDEKAIWTGATVCKILRDERYLGKMVSRKHTSLQIGSKKTKRINKSEWIVVEDTHEAIISNELFETAKQRMDERIVHCGRRSNTSVNNLYLCPYCMHKLQRSNGKQRFVYCAYGKTSKDARCLKVHQPVSKIEESIVVILGKMYEMYASSRQSDEVFGHGRSMKEDAQSDIMFNRRRINELTSRKVHIYEQYRKRTISIEEFTELQNKIKDKIKQLEDETVFIESKVKQNIEEQKLDTKSMEILNKIRAYHIEQSMLNSILENIYVYQGGEIELVFRCRDFW